jgi:hypothetical protein
LGEGRGSCEQGAGEEEETRFHGKMETTPIL